MVENTIKWLGDIPPDWEVTRISSLFAERNEKVNDVDYPPLSVTKKGILLFIGAMISGVLMLLIIGWLTWLVIWGYGIYDAYNSAQKMNSGIAVEDTIDFNNLF